MFELLTHFFILFIKGKDFTVTNPNDRRCPLQLTRNSSMDAGSEYDTFFAVNELTNHVTLMDETETFVINR